MVFSISLCSSCNIKNIWDDLLMDELLISGQIVWDQLRTDFLHVQFVIYNFSDNFSIGLYSLSNCPNAHTTISTHNFIDFGHCWWSWNRDRLTWMLVILGSLLAFKIVYTIQKRTHEIENSYHRSFSTTCSPQLFVFFIAHCYQHESKHVYFSPR